MDNLQFQQLIAELGELTEVQRQTIAAMLSGHGDLAEVTSLIEARFAVQAICPHCQSKNVGSWGRACGLKRYRCRDCRKSFNALTKTPLARLHCARDGVPDVLHGLYIREEIEEERRVTERQEIAPVSTADELSPPPAPEPAPEGELQASARVAARAAAPVP